VLPAVVPLKLPRLANATTSRVAISMWTAHVSWTSCLLFVECQQISRHEVARQTNLDRSSEVRE
jgi:hypothetical protein